MLEILLSELWATERRPAAKLVTAERLYGDLIIKANGIELPGPEDVRNSEVSIDHWVHDLIRLREMVRLAYTKQKVSAGTAADVIHVYSRKDENDDDVLLKVVKIGTRTRVKGFEGLRLPPARWSRKRAGFGGTFNHCCWRSRQNHGQEAGGAVSHTKNGTRGERR